MRYTPRQVDEMTVWELAVCAKGVTDAHSPKKNKEPVDVSDDRLKKMGIAGFGGDL